MIGEKNTFFGYSEEEIKSIYASKQSVHVSASEKIEPDKSALQTLSEASAKLLKEDDEFLKEVYQ